MKNINDLFKMVLRIEKSRIVESVNVDGDEKMLITTGSVHPLNFFI